MDERMPNKTIYVADGDGPLFERAQALAGGNLSAAIAQAIRQLVDGDGEWAMRVGPASDDAEDADRAAPTAHAYGVSGRSQPGVFEDVIVKVGKGGAYAKKRFRGRLLGVQRVSGTPGSLTIYRVYQTEKGRMALRITESPDWSADWRTWGIPGAGGAWSRGADKRSGRGRDRPRGGRADFAWDFQSNVGHFAFHGGDQGGAAPSVPQSPGLPQPPQSPGLPQPPQSPGLPQSPQPPPGQAAHTSAETIPPPPRDGAWWESNHRLEVYETTADLRSHIPPELYDVISQALTGAEIEDLDI